MHLRRDVLSFPGRKDAWEEISYVSGTFSNLFGVEDDVVVMKVKYHWNVQFFT